LDFGPVCLSVNRQERLPKEIVDVPGLLPYSRTFHFDQRKWPRRVPSRVVLKLFDEGLELTHLHAERDRQHLLGRKILHTLALVFSEQDPK
jgi:hypothetical protein